MASSGQAISAANIIKEFNTSVRDVIMKNTYGLHNLPKDPSSSSITCLPTSMMGNPAGIGNPEIKAGETVTGRTLWKALVDVTKQLTRVGTFTYVRRTQWSRNTPTTEYAYTYIDEYGYLIRNTNSDDYYGYNDAETDVSKIPENATAVPGPLIFRRIETSSVIHGLKGHVLTGSTGGPITRIDDLPDAYYFKVYAKYYVRNNGDWRVYGQPILDDQGRLISRKEDLPDKTVTATYMQYFVKGDIGQHYISRRGYPVIVDNQGKPITDRDKIPENLKNNYSVQTGDLYLFKDGRVLVDSEGCAITNVNDLPYGVVIPRLVTGEIYVNKKLCPAYDADGKAIVRVSTNGSYGYQFVTVCAYVYTDSRGNVLVDSNGFPLTDTTSLFDDSRIWNDTGYMTREGKVITYSGIGVSGTINKDQSIMNFTDIGIYFESPGTVTIPADTIRYKLVASSLLSGKVLYNDKYQVDLHIPNISFGSTCHFAPTTGRGSDNTNNPPTISGTIYANHVNYIIAACLNGWQNANKHHEDIVNDVCHDICHSNCYGNSSCYLQDNCYNDGDSSCYMEEGCYQAH